DQISLDTRHPEFSRWTWLSPRDLVERIVPFKRDVYARVMEAFADRLSPPGSTPPPPRRAP
ncbi:MAG: hypothetical protein D6811_13040, partial [Alphaproteobacteria bacterium]